MMSGGKMMSGNEDVTIQRRKVMCEKGYFEGYDNNQKYAQECAAKKTETTSEPHIAFMCKKDPFGYFDSYCVVKESSPAGQVGQMVNALKNLLEGWGK